MIRGERLDEIWRSIAANGTDQTIVNIERQYQETIEQAEHLLATLRRYAEQYGGPKE